MGVRSRAGRPLRTAVATLTVAALLSACIGQVSDAEQIRSVTGREAESINHGDIDAAYRLTDLDFRAVCPRDRFTSTIAAGWLALVPIQIESAGDIRIRGARGEASVSLTTRRGARVERRQFVKDGGRWYIYGDAVACGASVD